MSDERAARRGDEADWGEPRMRSSPEFDLIGAIRDRLAATAPGGAERDQDRNRRRRRGHDDPGGRGDGGQRRCARRRRRFRRSWCPPRSIGRKAMGAALSDLAAMGAAPAEAYVWIGIPSDFGREECLELCDGLADLAEREGAARARRRPDRIGRCSPSA